MLPSRIYKVWQHKFSSYRVNVHCGKCHVCSTVRSKVVWKNGLMLRILEWLFHIKIRPSDRTTPGNLCHCCPQIPIWKINLLWNAPSKIQFNPTCLTTIKEETWTSQMTQFLCCCKPPNLYTSLFDGLKWLTARFYVAESCMLSGSTMSIKSHSRES